jgi:hypothetical protein
MLQRRPQKFRFDLEMAVGLEFGIAARAHVMQHENGADACEHWPQQVVSSRQRERFQPGADNGVAELFHGALLAGWSSTQN